MALAHAVGDKVKAAYRRGDLFDRRHRIMADWAKFYASKSANLAQSSSLPQERIGSIRGG
jgi:hypothetical protein